MKQNSPQIKFTNMFYPLLLEGLPSTGFASLTGGYWKDVRDVRLHLEILLQGGVWVGGWVGGGWLLYFGG